MILKAADFAADRHRKQRRKGRKKRPYIGHCTEVARLIAEVGEVDDAEVLAAAILHDTLEDTKTEPDELIEMFGQKTTRGAFIINLVKAGCAAYRTQLFCYLKACGRDELSTMNLWAGVDAPVAV